MAVDATVDATVLATELAAFELDACADEDCGDDELLAKFDGEPPRP